MTTLERELRHRVRVLLVAVVGASLTVVLAACGSGPSETAAAGTEASPATSAPVQELGVTPTTNPQGGFGLPPARPTDSLGIPGVTEVTFPETCEIQFVAEDGAIGFIVGSASVSPEGEANLATIAGRLVGAATVQVAGHTSSEGDPAFNQTLSEDRAAAVQAILEPLVQGASFSSEGRGFSEPVLGPDGAEDRAASRRVVITAQVPEETCSTFGS